MPDFLIYEHMQKNGHAPSYDVRLRRHSVNLLLRHQ